MHHSSFILFLICIVLLNTVSSCTEGTIDESSGGLFIIGGGQRPPEMIDQILQLSGMREGGNLVILPVASAEPDSADFYARRQFNSIDEERIFTVIPTSSGVSNTEYEILQNANLIYITGGSQSRFMDSVRNTNTEEAIREAYRSGAIIAGTSAGAAVQSKWMITGDQKKYPVYTGRFETIEGDNIILAEGLGLIENAIIDQHFIARQRLNRLISVIIENPGQTGIGIDESTAIFVKGNKATVYGQSQVVVLRCNKAKTQNEENLLGVDDMSLSIYLPGKTFKISE
jgi:cyanophycinase